MRKKTPNLPTPFLLYQSAADRSEDRPTCLTQIQSFWAPPSEDTVPPWEIHRVDAGARRKTGQMKRMHSKRIAWFWLWIEPNVSDDSTPCNVFGSSAAFCRFSVMNKRLAIKCWIKEAQWSACTHRRHAGTQHWYIWGSRSQSSFTGGAAVAAIKDSQQSLVRRHRGGSYSLAQGRWSHLWHQWEFHVLGSLFFFFLKEI